MDFLRQLSSGIAQAWRRLSASARINLVFAVLLTAAAVTATVVVLGVRPQYVRLYDGLSAEETAEIVDVVQQAGVKYKLENHDRTILVPLSDRGRMKLAVAGKGLPTSQGAVAGFDRFDGDRSRQDMNYMRAVQGELQRQLNEFDFVNKSFVFIREANEELSSSAPEPSKAAVTLDVNRPLTNPEIKAVLHTISSFGGAHLSPDNITLTTTDGAPLHLPPSSEFASIANSKLEYIAELEKQREDRVLKDFAKLGIRALVRVSADVDFTSETQTTKKSEAGAVLSSYSTTNTTASGEPLPRGAPGTVANLPEGAALSSGIDTNSSQEETFENFQPTTTETKTTREPGRVKGYVVSAIIEGQTKKTTDANGQETTEYIGLAPEKTAMYEKHIMAAVGQGEVPTQVTVSDHPFDIGTLSEAKTAFAEIERAKQRDLMLQYGKDAGKVLVLVVLFMMLRRMLRRAIVTPAYERGEEVRKRPGAAASPEDRRREDVAMEVERLSQEDPASVAAVLHTWLAQDEE